jgi:hypothetical protein
MGVEEALDVAQTQLKDTVSAAVTALQAVALAGLDEQQAQPDRQRHGHGHDQQQARSVLGTTDAALIPLEAVSLLVPEALLDALRLRYWRQR